MAKLRSERNIPEVEQEIRDMVMVVFERGQWWLVLQGAVTEHSFSVVDTNAGLDLEAL